MSDHERTSTIAAEAPSDGAEVLQFPRTRERKRRRLRLWRRRKRPKRFKVRKLRVLLRVLLPRRARDRLGACSGCSWRSRRTCRSSRTPAHQPSVIVDARGRQIGTLTGNERRIYLSETQIAPVMKHAIIAIEDRRFYTNSGVDLRGIARAAVEDVTSGGAVQGASTIPQQFVKISLAAENERTVFQKLREAALAYHLTRKWSKERILRNYLNSIYFGNGAYGIESAARTYFAYNHDGCGSAKDQPRAPRCCCRTRRRCCRRWSPPRARSTRSSTRSRPSSRRDLVLLRMLEQGYLTRAHLRRASKAEPMPDRATT